jgi:hypothetical protein
MPEVKKSQSPVDEKRSVDTVPSNAKNKPMDKKISDVIGPIFEEMKIEEGIVIAKMPGSDQVSVYFKGHFYDVATLVATIHRKFKDKIADEIS